MYFWVFCFVGMSFIDFVLMVLEKIGVVMIFGNVFGEGGERYVCLSLIVDGDCLGEVL